MRISDWSSDVFSSDLHPRGFRLPRARRRPHAAVSEASVRAAPLRAHALGNARAVRMVRRGARAVRSVRLAAEPDRKRVGSGQSGALRLGIGGRRTIYNRKNIVTNINDKVQSTE